MSTMTASASMLALTPMSAMPATALKSADPQGQGLDLWGLSLWGLSLWGLWAYVAWAHGAWAHGAWAHGAWAHVRPRLDPIHPCVGPLSAAG